MRKYTIIFALFALFSACSTQKEVVSTDTWVAVECGGLRFIYGKVITLENGLLVGVNGNDSTLLDKCKIVRKYQSENDTLFYTNRKGEKRIFGVSNRRKK